MGVKTVFRTHILLAEMPPLFFIQKTFVTNSMSVCTVLKHIKLKQLCSEKVTKGLSTFQVLSLITVQTLSIRFPLWQKFLSLERDLYQFVGGRDTYILQRICEKH